MPEQRSSSAADHVVSDLCEEAGELRRRNELDAALEVAEQALDRAKRSGDDELVGECLTTLADIYHDKENYSQAERLYRQALTAFQEAGAERGQGVAHLGLGIVYLDRGDLERAEQALLSALELAQRTDDLRLEGATYVNLGLLHAERGQLQEARTYHEQAVRLFESLESDRGIAIQLTNLALIYVRMGEIEKALACHEHALEMDQELGNERGVATDYGNLSDIHYELGDLGKAEEYYRLSLRHAQKLSYREQEGKAHNGLALVAVSQGDLTTARDHYTAALEAFQAIGFRQGEAGAHVDLGYTSALCGDVDEGVRHCRQGLDIYQTLGHPEGELAAHLCLGYISLMLLDDPDEAIAQYTDARELVAQLQQPDLVWRVYVGLGSGYYRQGQWEKAYETYREAVDAVESIRAGLWREESKLGFIGSKSGLYTVVVMLSVARRPAGEDSALIDALEYLERGRSRSFLDLLGQADISASRSVDASLLKREAELIEQIRVLTHTLTDASGERRLALLQRANDARGTLHRLLDDIAQIAPEYVDLRRGAPASWEELQACLRQT